MGIYRHGNEHGNGYRRRKKLLAPPLPRVWQTLWMFFFFNKIIWGGVSWRLHWYGLWTMDMETWKWTWRMEKACLHPSSVFVNVFSIRWYEEGREGREDTCLAPVMRPPWVIHTPSTTLCDIQTNTVQYLNKYGAIFKEILWVFKGILCNIQWNTVEYW